MEAFKSLQSRRMLTAPPANKRPATQQLQSPSPSKRVSNPYSSADQSSPHKHTGLDSSASSNFNALISSTSFEIEDEFMDASEHVTPDPEINAHAPSDVTMRNGEDPLGDLERAAELQSSSPAKEVAEESSSTGEHHTNVWSPRAPQTEDSRITKHSRVAEDPTAEETKAAVMQKTTNQSITHSVTGNSTQSIIDDIMATGEATAQHIKDEAASEKSGGVSRGGREIGSHGHVKREHNHACKGHTDGCDGLHGASTPPVCPRVLSRTPSVTLPKNACKDHTDSCDGSRGASMPPVSPRLLSRTTSATLPKTPPQQTDLQPKTAPTTVHVSPELRKHRILHDKALSLKPQLPLQAHRYWIAVLNTAGPTGKNHAGATKERDFLWMKGNRKTTVETVWNTYFNMTALGNFVLMQADEKPEFAASMEELDLFNDKMAVFRAVDEGSLEAKGRSIAEVIVIDD